MHEDVRKFRNASEKMEAEYAMAADGRADDVMREHNEIVANSAYEVAPKEDGEASAPKKAKK